LSACTHPLRERVNNTYNSVMAKVSANTTGTPVGAIITNAGTGLTNGWYGYVPSFTGIAIPGQSGPALPGTAVSIVNGAASLGNTAQTVTPSAGGSLWNAFVGGAVNTTITFTTSTTVYQNGPFGGTGTAYTANAGSNYTRPPLIVFTPPPNQGAQPYILPTAVCTISGGAINSITVTSEKSPISGTLISTVAIAFLACLLGRSCAMRSEQHAAEVAQNLAQIYVKASR
jgi:hypothetical protein